MKNKIDWEAYRNNLLASIKNEKIWELGCFDDYNPHTGNIENLEEELEMLENGDYNAIINNHEKEYFNDFML